MCTLFIWNLSGVFYYVQSPFVGHIRAKKIFSPLGNLLHWQCYDVKGPYLLVQSGYRHICQSGPKTVSAFILERQNFLPVNSACKTVNLSCVRKGIVKMLKYFFLLQSNWQITGGQLPLYSFCLFSERNSNLAWPVRLTTILWGKKNLPTIL